MGKIYIFNFKKVFQRLALLVLLTLSFNTLSFSQIRTYVDSVTVAGTYQLKIPCDVTTIIVECWGAGGGGGGAKGRPSGGGGGAGGGYAKRTLTVVPGTVVTLTVGAKGAAGVAGGGNGGDGGASFFSSLATVSALGGKGGSGATLANQSAAGGIALTGNVGDVVYNGGNGGTGSVGSAGGGGGSAGTGSNGNNGASPLGGAIVPGGAPGGNGGNATGDIGANGTAGSGGGGGKAPANANKKGGSGGDGKIKITFDSYLAGYCKPSFTTTEPITNVTFAGINNTTSEAITSPSYEVSCSEATVSAGNSYPISIKGNTNGNYTNKILVFIDWNRNQMIDANELTYPTDLVNSTGTDAIVSTGSIAVPAGTTPGKTFMRVVKLFTATTPDVCSGGTYGQAEDYVVNVIVDVPCSGTPVAGTATASPGSGAPLSNFILDATGGSTTSNITYQWQSSPDGTTSWTDISGATTQNFAATAVLPITTTYYRLIVKCVGSGISSTSSTVTFTTVAVVCNPTATNQTDRYIKRVDFIGTLNDVSNLSGYSASPKGYQDFTGLPNRAKQAQSEGINVYLENNFRVQIKAWIDWNQNGYFEAGEEVYSSGDVFTTTTIFGFVVPASASPGNYKIRIRTYNSIDFSVPDLPIVPCGTMANGETEDYLFTVIEKCPAVIISVTDGDRCDNGPITLTVTGSPGTSKFLFYNTLTGGSVVGTSTSGSWTTGDIGVSTVYYVTAYNGTCESLVRTPIKASIRPIPILSFSPANPVVCGEGAVLQLDAAGETEEGILVNESFEGATYLFSQVYISGLNIAKVRWGIETSVLVPSITEVWHPAVSSGFSGNKFAFATYDVSEMYLKNSENAFQLTTAVNSTAYTNLFVSFDIYYDHYLSDGDNSIMDYMYVEVSRNGTTWNTVATYNGDQGVGTKFLNIIIDLSSYINETNLKIRFRYKGEWVNGVALDNIKLYGSKPLPPSFSWTPTSGGNLFLDAAGTTPYTGGSVPNVYVKPTAAQLLAGLDLNFNATVSLSNGCASTAPVIVKIGPSTWTGTFNNQWHNVNNWCSKSIPSATTVVEIAPGSPYMPVITTNALAKSISVKAGATLSIASNGSLTVNGVFNNLGTLVNNGKITLNGTSPQTFPGTGVVTAMSDLEISNTSGVSLNKSLSISSQLIPTAGTLNLGTFDITLLSGVSKTASVAAIGSNADFAYGTGRFVYQRYIATGAHGKGWQLLSNPIVEGKTIFAAWQNNGVATPGKGTLIHHNLYNGANGFDVGVAITPSIKSYNYLNNDWTIFPDNTNSTLLDNPHGYLLFVRGDRTVAFPANPTSPTVLSNRGKIYTGKAGYIPPSITVYADKFESVGNPYASQIDFTKITKTPSVDNKFYVWDPLLLGAYQLGGYQVISATTSWKPVPGSLYYPAATAKKTIESGQAFLVHASGANGTVSFTEAVKSVGSGLVNRPENNNDLQMLRANLFTDINEIADGNAVVFSSAFSNNIDVDDATKIQNSGENFGILRYSKILAVEARSPVISSDTIFYNLSKPALNRTYNLIFEPENMDIDLTAELIDNYTGIRSFVSLADVTTFTVKFNSDPNSTKANRFMLVFNRGIAGPLPVTFVSVSAIKNNKDVNVNWKVSNEINIEKYIVERTYDTRIFNEILTANPDNSGAYIKIDYNPLSGTKFYRIKAISNNGMVQYSSIVKVSDEELMSSINVYPNPLVNRTVNVQFLNQPKGKYSLRIINSLGQIVYYGTEDIRSNNIIKNIEVPKVTTGIYKLIILKPGGETENIRVLVN